MLTRREWRAHRQFWNVVTTACEKPLSRVGTQVTLWPCCDGVAHMWRYRSVIRRVAVSHGVSTVYSTHRTIYILNKYMYVQRKKKTFESLVLSVMDCSCSDPSMSLRRRCTINRLGVRRGSGRRETIGGGYGGHVRVRGGGREAKVKFTRSQRDHR